MIWTLAFWKGAAERAIKTAAQSLAGVFIVGVPILGINWRLGLGLAATITVASILTSIGNADFTAGVLPAPVHPGAHAAELVPVAVPAVIPATVPAQPLE